MLEICLVAWYVFGFRQDYKLLTSSACIALSFTLCVWHAVSFLMLGHIKCVQATAYGGYSAYGGQSGQSGKLLIGCIATDLLNCLLSG